MPADIVAARHHSLPLPSPLAPGKHEYPGSENKDEVIPASRWDPDSFDDETRNARRGGNEEHEEPNTGTTTTKGKTNPEGWPSRAGAARRPRIMMSATRITAIGEGWRAGLRIYPANDPVRDEAGVEEEEEEEEGVFTRPTPPPRSPLLASQQSAVRRCVFHLRNPQMDRRIPPFATVNIFSPSRLKVADEKGGGCATAGLDWPSVAITAETLATPSVEESRGRGRVICGESVTFFLPPRASCAAAGRKRKQQLKASLLPSPSRPSILLLTPRETPY